MATHRPRTVPQLAREHGRDAQAEFSSVLSAVWTPVVDDEFGELLAKFDGLPAREGMPSR